MHLPGHIAGPRLDIADEPSASHLDTVKAYFTYFIVATVVIGGGMMLWGMRLDPPESGSATLSLAIVGFIGMVLAFITNQEVQTRTARQAASATAANTAATTATLAAANSGVGDTAGPGRVRTP